MNKETLIKANKLNSRIKELTESLNCFERKDIGKDGEKFFSTNPSLIIEYDGGDGREQQPLPMNLSNELISFLKSAINKSLNEAVDEFNAL